MTLTDVVISLWHGQESDYIVLLINDIWRRWWRGDGQQSFFFNSSFVYVFLIENE